MFLEVKLSSIANSSLNLAETKFSRHHILVVNLANFKSRALSRDRAMSRVKVRVRAQASY